MTLIFSFVICLSFRPCQYWVGVIGIIIVFTLYLADWVMVCTFIESKLRVTEVKSSWISFLTTALASPVE